MSGVDPLVYLETIVAKLVLAIAAGAERSFGATGFVATSFLAGLVSSGTAATTAVAGIIAGTVSSIVVKPVFAASIGRELVRPVLAWNLVSIAVGLLVGVPAVLL